MYLQLEGGTWSLGIEKISTETENVSVLTPYRIMYATVTLSYFTYVERHEDIISTRTSSETLIKKYLSIEQKLCEGGVRGVRIPQYRTW